jgi:hypothetical protein
MAHYFTLAINDKISVDEALEKTTQDIKLDKVLIK